MLQPVSKSSLTSGDRNKKLDFSEELLHIKLKMRPKMTETLKINHFSPNMRREALQTLPNMNPPDKETLEIVGFVIAGEYFETKSRATAKNKWHNITFDPKAIASPDLFKGTHRVRQKSVWHQNSIHDAESSLRLICPSSQAINQLGRSRKRQIRRNRSALRKKLATCKLMMKYQTKTQQTETFCIRFRKSDHWIMVYRKKLEKERQQENDIPSDTRIHQHQKLLYLVHIASRRTTFHRKVDIALMLPSERKVLNKTDQHKINNERVNKGTGRAVGTKPVISIFKNALTYKKGRLHFIQTVYYT